MLSKEDNELITNTDRGTPMGEWFRRFWMPAALSEEAPSPDSVPVRVTLLGERLILFRDSNGRVGLVDAYCPHRGAAMFFARNEEAGIRCIYHGWKFETDGQCVDLPSAAEGPTFKDKISIKSYPCEEHGGVVWTYMGPANKKPPFPDFLWKDLPTTHTLAKKYFVECNWMQCLEGNFDPVHTHFLHSRLEGNQWWPGALKWEGPEDYDQREPDPFPRAVGPWRRIITPYPTDFQDIEAGIKPTYARQLPDGRVTQRINPWLMPSILASAGGSNPNISGISMQVPVTNTSVLVYSVRWCSDPIPDEDRAQSQNARELIPGTYMPVANVHNDYNVDREMQRTQNYSGMAVVATQDTALQENQWGPLADRRNEHLSSSDALIIHIRQRLIKEGRAMAQGIEPVAPWRPEQYTHNEPPMFWYTTVVSEEPIKASAGA